MKKILLTAFILAGLISCNTIKTDTKKSTLQVKKQEMMIKEDKYKIEELLSQYEKALNNSDAKLAQSLYTKDGVFMPTEAPSGIGSQGILESYEFVFSQIQLNIAFFIEEIEIDENMAFAVTSSKGKVKIKANGTEVPEEKA